MPNDSQSGNKPQKAANVLNFNAPQNSQKRPYEQYQHGKNLIPLPHPDRIEDVARALVDEKFLPPLLYDYKASEWWKWQGYRWKKFQERHIIGAISGILGRAAYRNVEGDLTLWPKTSPTMTGAIIESLKSLLLLERVGQDDTERTVGTLAPIQDDFIQTGYCLQPASPRVLMDNGYFDLEAGEFKPVADRYYFSTWSLPHTYDEKATCPNWFKFLEDVFAHDPAGINQLQEWFGYVLSGETAAKKAYVLAGAAHSGKSTITDVLRQLVGKSSCAGGEFRRLGSKFALASWVGKALVTFDEAANDRGMKNATAIIKRVTGNDDVVVEGKGKQEIQVKMSARLMFITNGTPAFKDETGTAIELRLVAVKLKTSFIGREDWGLKGRLLQELPGIFNWAMGGYIRLRANKWQFTQTRTGKAMIDEIASQANATIEWMNEQERFTVTGEPADRATIDDMYKEFKWWRSGEGKTSFYSKGNFKMDLQSSYPQISLTHARKGTDGSRPWEAIGIRDNRPGGLVS